jgi:hypothetical protein
MSNTKRTVQLLLVAAAAETLLTIGHFGYGAHHYDDPARLHVVGPAIGFLVLAGALGLLYLWRPRWWTLSLLVLEVGGVYIGLFGGFHGAFNHALKDILFLAGTSADRLTDIFDSPDFTLPNSVIYEATGLATIAFAGLVAYYAVRLVRQYRRES